MQQVHEACGIEEARGICKIVNTRLLLKFFVQITLSRTVFYWIFSDTYPYLGSVNIELRARLHLLSSSLSVNTDYIMYITESIKLRYIINKTILLNLVPWLLTKKKKHYHKDIHSSRNWITDIILILYSAIVSIKVVLITLYLSLALFIKTFAIYINYNSKQANPS